MKVLMVGVDKQTKGGMWTVVENYLNNKSFCEKTGLKYISTSITGSVLSRVLFAFKAYLLIFGSLLKEHYDIVHIHMSERGSVYRKYIVILLAKLFHCKIILHMHGAEFEKWYFNINENKQNFVRKVVNRADKVLILGQYWWPFISSLLTDNSKLTVLYNAVNVPSQNQYNPSAKNALFLGAVIQRKGIYDLLDAFMQIDTNLDEQCKLIIYGPDFDNNIQDEIKSRNLGKRVLYKGWLDKTEQQQVFSDIAINVLPSYNEGLPMTILETMAFGIPNITTDVAAIPEAVSEKNGFLVNPGDNKRLASIILNIMGNDSLRVEKSSESHKTAIKKFSIERHLDDLIKIYEELVR